MNRSADIVVFPDDENPASGFSLIDMLVALLLLSVVAGLMAAFIGQFRTIMRLESNVSAQMELDALANYLEASIGNALPLPFVDSQGETRLSFEGTESGVRFVSIARQGVKAFGLRETSVALKGDGKLRTLVQGFAPRRLDSAARATATTTVDLAENVAALTFQYLSYDDATKAPIWTETWLSKSGLPAAVRINLTIERDRRTLAASGYAILALSVGTQQATQAAAAE